MRTNPLSLPIPTLLLNPTLWICAIALGIHLGGFTSLALLQLTPNGMSPFLGISVFLINTLCIIVLFTPLHDATHLSADSNKRINSFILYSVWPAFLINPHLFRQIHIQHHAATNDPDRDPDHFTSDRSLAFRWLRSFFLIFEYHTFYFRHFGARSKDRNHMMLSVLFQILLLVTLFTPIQLAVAVGLIAPAIVGIGILAFINTSWPHHPAKERDRIKNTLNHYVPWPLQLLMLNQNLHLVHHLNPSIPWYRYRQWWKEHHEEYEKLGARSVSILGRTTF